MTTNTIKRLNKACAYFPCHKGLSDCTFCYCPFYPCGDINKGRYIVTEKGRKIWSCRSCSWIHKKDIVDNIFYMLRSNEIKVCKSVAKIKGEKTGIVILGHGSSLKKANGTVRKAAEMVKLRSGLDVVEPAYLQLCEPSPQKVIKKIVKMGCKKVIIVPFFLFTGNHVSRDIPNVIKRESEIYKEVKFIYAKTIGQDPRINNIVMDRIQEAAI